MAQVKSLPYTYLIKWTALNKWYYGVRHAKGCHPSEFWKKYFTSSKYVKQLLKEFGNPDVIQIRKTFRDAKRAITWEKKVLTKMRVLERNDSLNMNIAGSIIISPEKYANVAKKRKSQKENYNSWDQTQEKNPMWGKRWITNGVESKVVEKDSVTPDGWQNGRKMCLSQNESKVIRSSRTTRYETSTKGTIWITDDIENKRIPSGEIIPSGWRRGHTVKDKNSIKGSSNTIWITDGAKNKKIHKTSSIPDGWRKGRSNSFPDRWSKK